MMKKLILLIALLTLVAFVSGVMAEEKPAPAPAKPATTLAPAPAPAPAKPATAPAPAPEKVKLEKFSGTIEKIDEMAKAIDVKGKAKTLIIAIDDSTKITKALKPLAFADLKKGMYVTVEYKKDGDKMIAVAIKAAAPKAKAAPKKAEEKPAEAKPAEAPK